MGNTSSEDIRVEKTAVVLICLFMVALSPGAIITVDDDGPADFSNIQAAIDSANYGDTVVIAPGTYTGPGNRGLELLGKAITVRSTDPNDPTVVAATVIDCEWKDEGFNFYQGETTSTVISGLTITYGSGNGAIACDGASPTITRCRIEHNSGSYSGGIYCFDSNAVISYCIVSNNWRTGITCMDSSPTISNCVISDNRYDEGGDQVEGGIYCVGKSYPKIRNCIIRDNWTHFSGAGINLWDVVSSDTNKVIIANCTIINNEALHGGVFNIGGGPSEVTNCIIGSEGSIHDYPMLTEDGHAMPHSLVFNAGDPSYVPLPGETDIDGEPRVMDGRIDI